MIKVTGNQSFNAINFKANNSDSKSSLKKQPTRDVFIKNGAFGDAHAEVTEEQFKQIKSLENKGYQIRVQNLQNSKGNIVKATKEDYDDNFNTYVDMDCSFYPNGETVVKRKETDCKTLKIIGRTIGSNSTSVVECRYDEPKYRGYTNIDKKYEIIRDKNSPVEIIETASSGVLQGAYEVTRYKLSNYPEDLDVIKAIKYGSINDICPGEKLSAVVKNKDGSVTFDENFEQDGIKTKRSYTQKTDENNKVLWSKNNYFIQDETGKVLLNMERSYEKKSQNTRITTVNDKKYVAKFDDKEKKILILTPNGEEKEYNTKPLLQAEYTYDDSRAATDELWNFMKEIPADILINIMDNVPEIEIIKCIANSGVDMDNLSLSLITDLSTAAHETGHIINYSNNRNLEKDPELVETYNEEMENFEKKYSDIDNFFISYLSRHGGGPYNSGLDETIAETMSILTKYNFEKYYSSRGHYLVKYFPKTVACIANKLGYN